MSDYRGALSEPDYLECVRLRRAVVREGGTATDPFLWFGGLFAAITVFEVRAGYLIALSWLPFVFLCFGLWSWRRGKALRLWRSQEALRAVCRGTVDEAGYEAHVAGDTKRVGWEFFSRHIASPRAVVIFARRGGSVFLTRAMFASDDDWRAALGSVAANVPVASLSLWRRYPPLFFWIAGLLLLFLAWHFAQIQKPDRPRPAVGGVPR